ncbi:hypothetical protein OSB04_029665 [Centaurea solstitialis]|uniref:Uncharacterized protein n=1 Tax=Centaurea solstitialis TaxID=347529 RepID=A0AA38VSG7_9ASTR|nr:hypothetical protein OSB04_029665 [Centaurea solstitialis]
MFQPPPFDMENGNSLQMIPFDENDPEVIARRIKNRERQRRYRARKRQEADLKRACMINQSIQMQVDETQVKDPPLEVVTRVYSQRNWKKDARRAHILKQQQNDGCSSTSAIADLQISGNQSNAIVEAREHSSKPSGRNWKAEARNKRKLTN